MAVLQYTTIFCPPECEMREIVDVNTGEISIGTEKTVLRSLAIGSCIVVAAYDVKNRYGALAHIMLPGRAPKKTQNPDKTKYAYNAINEMIKLFTNVGTNISDILLCLVGAGNVLQKDDDTICSNNIRSVTEILKENKLLLQAAILGGTKRKSVFLDVDNASISYTVGEGKETLLWQI